MDGPDRAPTNLEHRGLIRDQAIAHPLGAAVCAAGRLARHMLDSFGVEHGPQTRIVNRRVSEGEAALRERDKVAGKISGIHGRDIWWIENAQIAQVVPIEEMTMDARHSIH